MDVLIIVAHCLYFKNKERFSVSVQMKIEKGLDISIKAWAVTVCSTILYMFWL